MKVIRALATAVILVCAASDAGAMGRMPPWSLVGSSNGIALPNQ